MEISTYGAYTDGTNIWLPSANINALFKKKLTDSQEAEYLCSFEGDENPNAWKIGNVLCFENKLYFFSQYAYVVWIFDLHTLEMKKVKYHDRKSCFIPDIAQVGNEAWVMPRGFDDPIIIFDLLTWQSEHLKLDKGENVSDEFSFTYSWEEKRVLYFATRACGNIHVGKLNCTNRKIQYKNIIKVKYVNCLTVQKGILYVLALDDENKAVLKKYKTDCMTEEESMVLSKINSLWNDATMFYFRMMSFEKYIIMLPGHAQEVVIYNTETKKESSIPLPSEFLHSCKKGDMSYFNKVNMVGNRLYFFPYAGRCLLVFDLQNFKFEQKEIICNEENVWRKYGERRKTGEAMEESAHVAVYNYLNYVLSNTEDMHRKAGFGCGNRIYDIVSGKCKSEREKIDLK